MQYLPIGKETLWQDLVFILSCVEENRPETQKLSGWLEIKNEENNVQEKTHTVEGLSSHGREATRRGLPWEASLGQTGLTCKGLESALSRPIFSNWRLVYSQPVFHAFAHLADTKTKEEVFLACSILHAECFSVFICY